MVKTLFESFSLRRGSSRERRLVRAWPIVALALLACGAPIEPEPEPEPEGPPPELEPTSSPRFHSVSLIATHNSYWVQRGIIGDAFASGVSERLADQLLFDGARAIELDIHPSAERPGEFDVYHTLAGNSLCGTLADCLAALRVVQRTLGRHEVITIVIELKELYGPTFDDAHRIEDFDASLERELGPFLYRPSEFLARCDSGATLAACAREKGWPTIEELRGRFLVAVLGNWDVFGGRGTHDWARYATEGDIAQRAAFPMASSWKLDYDALPAHEQSTVTREAIEAAEPQSIFLQVESLDDPNIDPWLERRAVIRVDNAFDVETQRTFMSRGMQLLQTDFPWIHTDERSAALPFVAVDPSAFDPSVLFEPGVRFSLEPGAPVFAWWTPLNPGTWEAAIVSGNANERFGCLRAESDRGVDTFEVCRIKVDADRTEGATGSPDWEQASVRVAACDRHGCTNSVMPALDPAGDLIGMAIDGACARALLAQRVGVDLEPQWIEVSSACFGASLVRQGIARAEDASASAAPSLFVGVRRNGTEVAASDLAGVRVGSTDDPTRFSDLSFP